MGRSAQLCLTAGVLGLVLCVVNQWTAPALTPALERAGVLASFLAVGLMLVAILWTRAMPLAPERVDLVGEQGLVLDGTLPGDLQQELAWGSQMLLTATPAASVLLQRGVLGTQAFTPAAITARAQQSGKAVSLVNLVLYPGRDEFVGLPQGIPAVIVQPIGSEGVLLVGGWSPRCFSRSDETWVAGWAAKLRTALESLACDAPGPGSSGEG